MKECKKLTSPSEKNPPHFFPLFYTKQLKKKMSCRCRVFGITFSRLIRHTLRESTFRRWTERPVLPIHTNWRSESNFKWTFGQSWSWESVWLAWEADRGYGKLRSYGSASNSAKWLKGKELKNRLYELPKSSSLIPSTGRQGASRANQTHS